jgi:alpha-galactosidase
MMSSRLYDIDSNTSDNEAVTHFSMWAIMSSPLIIGTDVRTLDAANLAIYSNPAVIALNQDPSGSAATRVWRYLCNDTDVYGQCETALWVRSLANGDFAIALLNGANSTMNLTATAEDIFVYNDLTGTSKPGPQISSTWDIHDLWANRMSAAEAQAIINANSTTGADIFSNSTTRYNATATSYAKGLMANSTALMGVKVGQLAPSGTFTAEVARHSVGLFRLRQVANSMRKRDEL